MAKTRNDSIDIVKGICILLVVLEHTISPVMGDSVFLKWFYPLFYNVVLAPFVFVTGYFSVKLITKPIPKLELLKQRASRLMIPYCVWAIIYAPMKIIMSDHVRFDSEYKWYTFFFGSNPDGELWYLYVIFILSVIMLFFVTEKNITAFTAFFVIVTFLAPWIPPEIGFSTIKLSFSVYQSGFFFLGALVALKFDYNKVTHNTVAFIISCVVFGAYAVFTWVIKDNVWYLEAATSFCGAYILLYLSHLISKLKFRQPLVYIGKKSMEIYIIHAPLLVAGRIILPKLISNTALYLLAINVIAISVSLLASMIINKFKIPRLLLFGAK